MDLILDFEENENELKFSLNLDEKAVVCFSSSNQQVMVNSSNIFIDISAVVCDDVHKFAGLCDKLYRFTGLCDDLGQGHHKSQIVCDYHQEFSGFCDDFISFHLYFIEKN